MVIDSSVLIAILFGEPDREPFKRAIDAAPTRLVSAMTKLESGIVMAGRFGPEGGRRLDDLLRDIAASIIPFTDHHADIARDAFVRYGKGRHKAGLNFGDCASYALAIAEAEPLLFKGTDFGSTDVEVVGAM
ncbi:MAG TPA: type II toxin-antitoxin system VapC family toxin [Pseudolabrys sp.]|nr:type II toxin-antitoxin system VapC family toxin [Pseudolabrys sp.]